MTHFINHITSKGLCGIDNPEPELIENYPDCKECLDKIIVEDEDTEDAPTK